MPKSPQHCFECDKKDEEIKRFSMTIKVIELSLIFFLPGLGIRHTSS